MNYGELKAAVASDTHRTGDPEVVAEIPRFIREAEGMIRRDLRGYILTYTLGETDRLSGGVYTLPGTVLEVRTLHVAGRQGDALEKMSPYNLRRISVTADPLWWADLGQGTIEIRGVPGTDAEFGLNYFGHPAALADDLDENDLLMDHETLYLAGAKFFLYRHTEDRELAQDELDIFNGVMQTLNDQIARKIGGGSIAPAYNFSGGSSY